MLVLPFGVAGEDDVAAPFEQRGKAVEGLAPHDHRAAHGELLEAAEGDGKVPGHPSVGADPAIGGAGEDHRELGSIHPGGVSIHVAWTYVCPAPPTTSPNT